MADSARHGRRNNRASRNRRGKSKKDQTPVVQPEEALGNESQSSLFGKRTYHPNMSHPSPSLTVSPTLTVQTRYNGRAHYRASPKVSQALYLVLYLLPTNLSGKHQSSLSTISPESSSSECIKHKKKRPISKAGRRPFVTTKPCIQIRSSRAC